MELTSSIYHSFQSGRLDDFYTRVYPSLLLFAARNLGDNYAFLAEDCVQDAIYQAYQRRSTFGTPSYLKSFLYQCIHNSAVSILRKYDSQQHYSHSQTGNAEPDPATAIIEQETLDLLFDAIDRLPGDLRQVFELSFEEHLTNLEAGQRMGISESGFKKKKAKMIVLLRQQFSDNAKMQFLITMLLLAH